MQEQLIHTHRSVNARRNSALTCAETGAHAETVHKQVQEPRVGLARHPTDGMYTQPRHHVIKTTREASAPTTKHAAVATTITKTATTDRFT